MINTSVKLPVTVENFEGPDSTYFVVGDVLPRFKDGKLFVCNYRGSHRNWGSPKCSSDVKQLNDDVLMINVVGWHKHTVSPVGGKYYFVKDSNNQWVRKSANAKVVKAALAT